MSYTRKRNRKKLNSPDYMNDTEKMDTLKE